MCDKWVSFCSIGGKGFVADNIERRMQWDSATNNGVALLQETCVACVGLVELCHQVRWFPCKYGSSPSAVTTELPCKQKMCMLCYNSICVTDPNYVFVMILTIEHMVVQFPVCSMLCNLDSQCITLFIYCKFTPNIFSYTPLIPLQYLQVLEPPAFCSVPWPFSKFSHPYTFWKYSCNRPDNFHSGTGWHKCRNIRIFGNIVCQKTRLLLYIPNCLSICTY